ncbi:hypothetical protein COTS27_00284 [Spirochaetota bacterium]|nr:hypothetical protein COTS27_00284 [Spirochaetota bacterium]
MNKVKEKTEPPPKTVKDKNAAKIEKEFKALLNNLLQLQDVYNRLNELEEEIHILSKQTQIEEQKYNSKQTQYENNLIPLNKVETEIKNIEAEVIDIQAKIELCEDTKKKIKTIKEFKAINKEIDFLNQQSAIKENQVLSKKDEATFRKNKLEKINENLQEIKQVFTEKKAEFDQLLDERKEDIKKWKSEKSRVEAHIEERWLAIFSRIYQNKNDLAIVSAAKSTAEENLVCQGCYTLLPRQVEIELKCNMEISYCPFCSRMLYHEDILE